MENLQEKEWHSMEARSVVEAFQSETTLGLSSQEAASRVERFGRNELTLKKGQGPIQRFLTQFRQALVIILLIASAITVVLKEYVDAAITITLAIGVSRMAKRHAIIRKLPAVETLGSVMGICSDKTGTLAQNQMTVQEVVSGGLRYSIAGVEYAPRGSIDSDRGEEDVLSNQALRELLMAGLLCNDSKLAETDAGWKVEGDPTEGALITAAMKAGYDSFEL